MILRIFYILLFATIFCFSGEKNVTEMVLIPAGEFTMGAANAEDDNPPHKVSVDSFYMDIHEVTNAQYEQFCRETNNPLPEFWGIDKYHCGSYFPDYPVVGISAYHAKKYAQWIGKRLPTEAEWEYAARGGLVDKKFPYGDDLTAEQGNFKSEGTLPVKSLQPNGFGLYDMAGNVVEWVADYYEKDYYLKSPHDNPKGPEMGKLVVIRGGGWHSGKMCTTVYGRNCLKLSWVDIAVGFRLVKDIK
ncbi:formylglycine-generating enzyme family protein [candidate division KSB1 bacterium]|nr:formylglycine-generating enzyme family protein [candidate division KSB1 bacterium]